MMGELAKAHGIKAVFASLTPVSDYHKDADPRFEMTKTRPPATIQAINSWIQTLCLNGGYAWMDYYSAMVDPMGQMKEDLSDDGLHPNAKGYRVMSPVVTATIDRILSHQTEDPAENAAKKRFRLLGR
jgi:lysophospholipase L1-like esterase